MSQAPRTALFVPAFRSIGIWGPGLLVMLADTDAGNVVTAAQSGARWGYRLLPLLLLLIPLLYMIQELSVRLGIFSGVGCGELIRKEFGKRWAWLAVFGLVIATTGTLVTEFTAVAGIGELYGLARGVTLPIAAIVLLAVVLKGSHRRVERVALAIGLFELAFFGVAWVAHPDLGIIARHAVDIPFGDHDFMFVAAALIGAVFNPWMVFYQQAAVADKKLQSMDLRAARWDTAVGAILTQILTAAVLVAAAATLGVHGTSHAALNSVGEISEALLPILGGRAARWVFSAGVLGAAMVAAIISSLALAWGISEVVHYRRLPGYSRLRVPHFYLIYGVAVTGSAMMVWACPDLVRLTIGTQVVNAFMLPVVIAFLIALSIKILPAQFTLRGWYLMLLMGISAATCLLGLYGGLSGLVG